VVIVLATRPKVCGFKTGRGHQIFKGEKIQCWTSFGGEIKPVVSCRKILRRVKYPYSRNRDTCRQNSRTFLAK
jgi:hypothetical protein